MALYIIRHGETRWNVEKRKQGHSDSPLTLKGINQAGNVCRILRKESIDLNEYEIFVSPLFRAQQFAQIIIETLGLPQSAICEPLIKEHGFGSWEGLTQEEVDLKFPGESEKRANNFWQYTMPGGGESYDSISKRAKEFISKYGESQNMILICHEMISKVLRGNLLDLSQEDILHLNHPQEVVYRYSQNSIDPLR